MVYIISKFLRVCKIKGVIVSKIKVSIKYNQSLNFYNTEV